MVLKFSMKPVMEFVTLRNVSSWNRADEKYTYYVGERATQLKVNKLKIKKKIRMPENVNEENYISSYEGGKKGKYVEIVRCAFWNTKMWIFTMKTTDERDY